MVIDGESYNVSGDKKTLAMPLRALPNRTFSRMRLQRNVMRSHAVWDESHIT